MRQGNDKLKRAIEHAVTNVCKLRPDRLWFGVNEVEVTGRPVSRIKVWATLRFLPAGAPFCCGEPGCHLCLFGDRLLEINDVVRAEMNFPDAVSVEFDDRIGVKYEPGVTFESQRG